MSFWSVVAVAGLFVHLFCTCCAGERYAIYRGRCPNPAIPMALAAAAAPGKGGGVLDRPIEKVTPGRQSEFDVR